MRQIHLVNRPHQEQEEQQQQRLRRQREQGMHVCTYTCVYIICTVYVVLSNCVYACYSDGSSGYYTTIAIVVH